MKKTLVVILGLFFVNNIFAQDLSKLYDKVIPAVVTITVEEKEIVTDRMTMSKAVVTNEGLGSGVVISETGEIMTAAHVVEAAENVTVTFLNGEKVPAKVVTLNNDADVALVKLVWIPKDLKVVPIGNSDNVKIGNQVFVIGNPLGLEHSLSVGHISGRMADDNISDKFSRPEFFQTDASINHGNSGGPMFNMKGEVIGIVSFILSQSGGFEGIGFAATSNVAKHELLGEQPFWFGLTHQPLVGPAAEIFNLPQPMGLMVQKVATNSPADLAGVRPGVFNVNIEGNEFLAGGDIVLKVDQFDMSPDINIVAFRAAMASKKSGDSIPLKILRSGQVIELIVIVP
jgi:S1-C subfamily serine protease